MAKFEIKTIGFRVQPHDPDWFEGREALANKAVDLSVTTRKLSRELEMLSGAADPLALRTMRRLHQHGVTDKLVNEVGAFVSNVCVFAVPEIDPETRKFDWRYGLHVKPSGWSDTPPIFPADDDIFYFVLMRLIDAGITEVLRCQAPAPLDHAYQNSNKKCNNYYFARPSKKWCSPRCGVRVSTRASED